MTPSSLSSPLVLPFNEREARVFLENFRFDDAVLHPSLRTPFKEYDAGMLANISLRLVGLQAQSLCPAERDSLLGRALPLEHIESESIIGGLVQVYRSASMGVVRLALLEAESPGPYPNNVVLSVGGKLPERISIHPLVERGQGSIIVNALRNNLPVAAQGVESTFNYYCDGLREVLAARSVNSPVGVILQFARINGGFFYLNPSSSAVRFCDSAGVELNLPSLAEVVPVHNPLRQYREI